VESVPFWVDFFIDTFFIVDVMLNFRTAYMLPTGFLETRPRQIARHYMKGWLLIDCTASLPLTYLTLLHLLRSIACMCCPSPAGCPECGLFVYGVGTT
jgi:hypothetical protein